MNWIKVTDRLHDSISKVIVNCEYGVTIAEYSEYKNGNVLWWATTSIGTYEDSAEAKNVTHWMPLPEPPKD